MVLVRSRGQIMEAVVRALKAAGVPVAGVDRMVLMEQLAVMDLVALGRRSEEHTSELQSLMRNSYAVFCLQKKRPLHNKNCQSTSIDSSTQSAIYKNCGKTHTT